MNFPAFESPCSEIRLSRLPAVAVASGHGVIVSPEGEVVEVGRAELRAALDRQPHILCNLPLAARHLKLPAIPGLDVLELFAFVRPAHFCLPVVHGLAEALNIERTADGLAGEALILLEAAGRLLAELGAPDYAFRAGALPVAREMGRSGWAWAPLVLEALGATLEDHTNSATEPGMDVWNALPDWEDEAPPPPPGVEPVSPAEVAFRLNILLGPNAERRSAQNNYAVAAARAFRPPEHRLEPNLVLAEAGTGTGKTLGYIAPASLWAEKNQGTVWLSTYTKNLQRQLDQELDRLYPNPMVKAQKAVLRKGRENYLCLLNLQESGGGASAAGRILLGLTARWARFSRDGDMIGGDFPSWLGVYFGRNRVAQLTDRRGECIYSACAHYRRCFIERAIRKSRQADIVIANHALVMIQAATRRDEAELPRRYVFDEGHHLFDAADSAFSADLTGQEGAELRRWLRGADGGRGRARGLRRRIDDLIAGDGDAETLLGRILMAARALPAEGWLTRLAEDTPHGPAEVFLACVRQQVHARAQTQTQTQTAGDRPDDLYSLETPVAEPVEGLLEAARALDVALRELTQPLRELRLWLAKKLDQDAKTLESSERARIEAVCRSLALREEMVGEGWRAMLKSLGEPAPEGPQVFVDWFSVDRAQGHEIDSGMHRHWLDPTVPFSAAVLEPADGVLITSATLRDGEAGPEDWQSAEIRTGASHLVRPAERLSLASPFDYASQTRLFIVNDLGRGNLDALAAAFRELFLASGGGALGLFTAIARLRGVYERLAEPLEAAGLALYAQHIDPIDTGTLVDIFRAEEQSCLLGTDAIRDGVDVPGRSLRLIVFDKVPWPRPTILHKERRKLFGGALYDDMTTRLRLKQAFGRLIRRADDKGVFVLLDGAMPSRLLTAFPSGTPMERLGLAEAIAKCRAFLEENSND